MFVTNRNQEPLINPYSRRNVSALQRGRCEFVAIYSSQSLRQGERCNESTRTGSRYCTLHRQYRPSTSNAQLNSVIRTRRIRNTPLRARNPTILSDIEPHSLEEQIRCPHCGARVWLEEKATNSTQNSPTFSICCRNGRLADITPYTEANDAIVDLLRPSHPQHQQFKNNIRAYNTLLSFASVISHQHPDIPQHRHNVFSFCVSGNILHSVPTIPNDISSAAFGSIYFFEPSQQIQARRRIMPGLLNEDIDLFELLQQSILTDNPYAEAYRLLHDTIATSSTHVPEERHIALLDPSESTNRPPMDQVAAIITNLPPVTNHDALIIRNTMNNTVEYDKISVINAHYDPLAYALLFPYGDAGWHINRAILYNGQYFLPSIADFYR